MLEWLTAGGVPANCMLESVEDAPIAELLKKGERLADGVARYQHRLRELAADAHRVRSAAWPSSLAKEKLRAQIAALAEAPDVDRAIEHNLPVGFPTISLSSLVRGTETPGLAFAETVNSFGFLLWAFRDQIIARIEQELDEIADDKHALDQQQREEMEAEISASALAVERSEIACILAAEAQGEIIDFRADTSPQALLGVRLVNQPRANPSPGTSPEHVITFAGVR